MICFTSNFCSKKNHPKRKAVTGLNNPKEETTAGFNFLIPLKNNLSANTAQAKHRYK